MGTCQQKASALVRWNLRPGDVFGDVGADLGYHTLLGAASVGPTGRVTAFEWIPPAWVRLEGNVGLNELGQVRLVNAAVSRAAGTASPFFANDVPDGLASLVAPPGHASRVTWRCRNEFWANPANDAHLERPEASGMLERRVRACCRVPAVPATGSTSGKGGGIR